MHDTDASKYGRLFATKLDDVAPNGGGSNSSSISSSGNKLKEIVMPALIAVAILAALGSQAGGLQASFSALVESSVMKISGMGSMGYLYCAAVSHRHSRGGQAIKILHNHYTPSPPYPLPPLNPTPLPLQIYIAAEVLAIPVFPLTASSGYLFGLVPGTLTVLISATIAACISFTIGRTVLRGWASKITSDWPKWKAIDGAIAKEGFKVILLLRLSPLLPFAVSNYIYGITSVDFTSFLFATFLGFAPGTMGIVYAGSAGKAFFAEGGSLPWYIFAGAGSVIIVAAQTLAKVAGDAIKSIEDENNAKKPL